MFVAFTPQAIDAVQHSPWSTSAKTIEIAFHFDSGGAIPAGAKRDAYRIYVATSQRFTGARRSSTTCSCIDVELARFFEYNRASIGWLSAVDGPRQGRQADHESAQMPDFRIP